MADRTAPSLISLTLPTKIDLSKGAKSAAFAAAARDEEGGSGVAYVALILDNKVVLEAGASSTLFVGAAYADDDTFNDSTPNSASSRISVSTLTGAGTYSITGVYVYDRAGNLATYDSTQLAQLGIHTSFSVVNTTVRDAVAPTLAGIKLPSIIDLSKGAGSAQFGVQATDNNGGSGVAYVVLILDNKVVLETGASSNLFVGPSYAGDDTFSDGTPNSASSSISFSALTGAGTYTVTGVYVYDVAGNVAAYNTTQLAQLGISSTFAVVNSTARDTVAPTLTDIKLPSVIDLSKGAMSPQFGVQATDNNGGSGVAYVALILDNKVVLDTGASSNLFVGPAYAGGDTFGDSTPTSATSSLSFSALTGAGTYNVTGAYVYDIAGNVATYNSTQLAQLGVNTSFVVIGSSATPAPSAAMAPSVQGDKVHLSLSSNDWTSSVNQFSLTIKYDSSDVSYETAALIGSGTSSFSISNQEVNAAGNLTINGSAANGAQGGAFLDLTFTARMPAGGVQYTVTKFEVNGKSQTLPAGGKSSMGYGSELADTLTGGRDYQNGGAGLDTIVYQGHTANYTIEKGLAGYSIKAISGTPELLANIERVKFADKMIGFDLAGSAGQMYRLYQAAFDRQPDQIGLGYWIKQMDDGVSLNSVAEGFIGSSEFTSLYGSASADSAFVNTLYNNILHRAPDTAGYDFWIQGLAAGASRAQLLADFSESAENQAQLIGAIEHGIAFIPYA